MENGEVRDNESFRTICISRQSMKGTDTDNCDTAVTAPLAGAGTKPMWGCMVTDSCTCSPHVFIQLYDLAH